jgi:hypothetical protein
MTGEEDNGAKCSLLPLVQALLCNEDGMVVVVRGCGPNKIYRFKIYTIAII